jgi:hypothetical protein
MSWTREAAQQQRSLSVLADIESEARKRLAAAFIIGSDGEVQRLGYLLERVSQARATVLGALAAIEDRAQAEGEGS